MPAITINRLTNANVYVNGESHLGQVEEINLPEVTHIMSEHKALGQVGKAEFFAGIDKMEATLKWNAFYSSAMKKFADPRKALKLQVRASLENYGSEGLNNEVPFVAYLTGMPKNFPMGNFKQHDNVEISSKMTVTYVKIEIDGELIVEYDWAANIYTVGDSDIFAAYRSNIGA